MSYLIHTLHTDRAGELVMADRYEVDARMPVPVTRFYERDLDEPTLTVVGPCMITPWRGA